MTAIKKLIAGCVFCFAILFLTSSVDALFSDRIANSSNIFSTGFWVTPSESEPTPTSTPTPTITLTPTPTAPLSSQTVIINELMWMGSNGDINDEWIELKNVTNSSIDISGWKLVGAANSGGTIVIPSNATIPANEFFLVTNYNSSNSILAIDPDVQTVSINLSNSVLQIILKNASDTVVDTAWNGSSPTVGSNVAPKKSMERNATFGDGSITTNWHTSTGSTNLDAATTESATPKAENSL